MVHIVTTGLYRANPNILYYMSVGVKTGVKFNHSEIGVELTAGLNRIICDKIRSSEGNDNIISGVERK
jgi:hypothetical protein